MVPLAPGIRSVYNKWKERWHNKLSKEEYAMKKNLIALVLILALCCLAAAAGAEIIHYDPGHTTHSFSGNTCTVCGWMQPGFYMGDEMVLSWDDLKSMGYVEVLDNGTLSKVVGNLEGKLVIGEDVTRVDGNMYPLFADTPLQEVWIPRTVTELGRYLTARTSIRVVRLYCPVTKLEDNAFDESLSKPACLETVWLPDTLTEIGNSAFDECTALKRLDLPDSVEKLGSRFLYNTYLTQINLPPRLRDVSSAFYSCSLDSIVLPASVEKMNGQAFSYCDARVIDLSQTQITQLPDQCFQYCKKLETLVLPAHLESFGWACFADNYALKRLVLPDGFSSLGNSWLSVEEIVWPVSLIDVNSQSPENLKTIYYRGSENQWKLNGANSKWDLSGVTVICNYTGN